MGGKKEAPFKRVTVTVNLKATAKRKARTVVVDGVQHGNLLVHRRDALHRDGTFDDKDGYQITHVPSGAFVFPPFHWTRAGRRLSYRGARWAAEKLHAAGGWGRSYDELQEDEEWLARTGELRMELSEDPEIDR